MFGQLLEEMEIVRAQPFYGRRFEQLGGVANRAPDLPIRPFGGVQRQFELGRLLLQLITAQGKSRQLSSGRWSSRRWLYMTWNKGFWFRLRSG